MRVANENVCTLEVKMILHRRKIPDLKQEVLALVTVKLTVEHAYFFEEAGCL